MRSRRCSQPSVRPKGSYERHAEENDEGFLGMADEEDAAEEEEDHFWDWVINDENDGEEDVSSRDAREDGGDDREGQHREEAEAEREVRGGDRPHVPAVARRGRRFAVRHRRQVLHQPREPTPE